MKSLARIPWLVGGGAKPGTVSVFCVVPSLCPEVFFMIIVLHTVMRNIKLKVLVK